MKFLLVVSALVAILAVVQGAQVKPEPKWFSIPLPFLNPTTKATTKAPLTITTTRATTTTKAPTTTTTTTTTAAPTTQAQNPAEPGHVSEKEIQAVADLFEMYPQLQGKENEVFNEKPEGPNPLDATFDTLPADLQEIIKTLIAYIESGKPLTDLNAPLDVTA